MRVKEREKEGGREEREGGREGGPYLGVVQEWLVGDLELGHTLVLPELGGEGEGGREGGREGGKDR